MRNSKRFHLTNPIIGLSQGVETQLDFLDISEPTGRCRTPLFQLKSIFKKAQIDFANNLKLEDDFIESVEKLQKQKEENKKKELTDAEKNAKILEEADGIIELLYGAGAEIEACFNALIHVLKMTGKFNGEFACNDDHFDNMTVKEQESLLGFYIANFI